MIEHISVIGANSLLAKELIVDLLRLNKKVIASDFSQAPEWLKEISKTECTWVQLDIKDHISLELAVAKNSCLFFMPHQSLCTQDYHGINQRNFLLYFSHEIIIQAVKSHVSKIIYLSAMISKDLSKKSLLYNRFEIENIFKESQIPVISLRLPLVLMSNLEPFQLIQKGISLFLVNIFPTWIEKQVQPIYWKDVVEIMIQILLDSSYSKITRNINLPGPELLSYRALFRLIAKKKKLRREIIISNFFPLKITAMVYSLFFNYKFAYLLKCFNSWNQDAVALTSDWKQKKSWVKVEDGLKYVLAEQSKLIHERVKCSVANSILIYKMELIGPYKAVELALEFVYWLQNFFFSVIRAEVKDKWWRVYFPQKLILLQEFELVKQSSESAVFLCHYGLAQKGASRLEFSIELSQARSRKFAFFTIKSKTSEFSYLEQRYYTFILNSFKKHLLKS